jgi:hypothetical protein
MGIGIEIYDQNQVLLLSNETMVLTTGLKETASLGDANYGVQDGYGGAYDVQTQRHINYQSTDFLYRKTPLGFPSSVWIMPQDGSKVYSVSQSTIAVATGSKYNVAYMKDDYPTSQDQYLSVYNPEGKLLWSAGALINCPIIVDKINLLNKSQVVIDLSKYGKDISKLYISCSVFGAIEYDDYGLSFVSGLALKRVGNTLYAGEFISSGSTATSGRSSKYPYHLYVAFIP